MNGMYGNYGGNMGMGMNDMSAMNYGGGYGGWNGMGGGYNQYNNGYNQMGGHNQSGAYPEMMNQFPKNNFSNQNQNRFPANQGGQYPQRNMRNGSHGGFGPGSQNANTRSGSQSGPAPNVRRFHNFPPRPIASVGKPPTSTWTDRSVSQQRDAQSPDGTANTASDAKVGDEQTKATAESTEEGKTNNKGIADFSDMPKKDDISGDATDVAGDITDPTGDGAHETTGSGLSAIQTFDSGDADMDEYNQPMMGNGMPYQHGMMNQGFDQSHMDPSFDPSMGMGYNNYGPRGGFNNGAYGAAKVLIDQPAEPIGVGVVGAPTGPRAMREGRPNTGFSSRVNSARFVPPARSVTSARESAAPGSPQRRPRSYVYDMYILKASVTDMPRRSPVRDESLRVKNRSPTRSRSRSREKGDVKDDYRERSRSADRESRRDDRVRSVSPRDEVEYDDQKECRHHRSSKYDERDEDYEDRYREDKASRGDRTRSASVESKYRSSRRDKDKHRSSRSHRDRSKDRSHRHRSRSPAEDKYEDDVAYGNGEKESDGSSRRKHRSDKDKYRDRSRDRERDRKDRKDRDRDYDYERSRDKDKDRKRRRDREAEEEDRSYDDEKHRSSRRSRKDRDRDRSSRRDDRDDHYTESKRSTLDKEEDIVGAMMKKRPVSPPLNAPTGPSANGFSIKGRSKTTMPPPAPVQPPSGPRNATATFQPPKGPAADRHRSESRDHRRKSSNVSVPASPVKEKEDHYAAERERNARERDSLAKSSHNSHSQSQSLSSRIKRPRDRDDDPIEAPRGPRAETSKQPPSGPSHRDKRRKSGTTRDDNIANLFTAGLRKNAKRRGGVRIEGEEGRDVERVERERERERR